MKLYAITIMLLAGVCAFGEAAAAKKDLNLGNVLYIGDSITHGFRAPSYRWALHKIFVDNGVKYKEIGIETGSHSQGIAPGTAYLDGVFENTHAAMSSQRAYETSGRKHVSKRLDQTDVFDWLNIPGKADSDKRRLDAVPNTALIMLGTNDLLSDHPNEVAKTAGAVTKEMLDERDGDICVIVNALRAVNPRVRVHVLSVPTWGETRQNTAPGDYEAVVKDYNAQLKGRFEKEFIDLNEGLVDLGNAEKLVSVPNFMNATDKLHPSRQGDLLIAGQVARAMGVAGRSAALPRKKAAAFSKKAADVMGAAGQQEGVALAGGKLVIQPGKGVKVEWQRRLSDGFTVELLPVVGDGSEGGWKKEPMLRVAIDDGVHCGQLNVSECYIMWGNTVLYPLDMSKNQEPVRVAWVPGAAQKQLEKGFYVWLGDMLIGEGLPDVGERVKGLQLSNLSDAPVTVSGFAAEAASYAPSTKNFVRKPAKVVFDAETPAAPKRK